MLLDKASVNGKMFLLSASRDFSGKGERDIKDLKHKSIILPSRHISLPTRPSSINYRYEYKGNAHDMQECDDMKVPDSLMDAKGMTAAIKASIHRGIDSIEKEFNVCLRNITVEDLDSSYDCIPYFVRYTENGGKHEPTLVFNGNFDFNNIYTIVERGYRRNYFAGRTLEDHMAHEMAHVMTGRKCRTAKEFEELNEKLTGSYVMGVSGYSDSVKDGFETIAEAFVKMKNRERVPRAARRLVEKYIIG